MKSPEEIISEIDKIFDEMACLNIGRPLPDGWPTSDWGPSAVHLLSAGATEIRLLRSELAYYKERLADAEMRRSGAGEVSADEIEKLNIARDEAVAAAYGGGVEDALSKTPIEERIFIGAAIILRLGVICVVATLAVLSVHFAVKFW